MTPRTALDRLLRPERVAFIGASARRSTAGGNQAIRNLQSAGYPGQIDVVNPSGGEIEGIRVTSRIADLPTPDVAFLSLPAHAVVDALVELDAIGCPGAIVPTTGLSDDDELRLRSFTAASSMLVHGPNCMGLINVTDQIPLWLDEGNLVDLPAGDIALVTQSGSAAIFVARSASPHGFSRIISTGNELALDAADYVTWLADDPRTSTIGLVLESIQRPAAFRAAVARARLAGKPVVVLRVGRTDSGARATTAHTGAVVADNAAYAALFDELDVPVVSDYDELATSLQLLSDLGGRPLGGSRLGVITISGGQAAMTADLAEELAVQLPPPDAELGAQLGELLPDVPINNPLDAGGSVVSSDTAYLEALDLMASDPGLDAVMVLLDCQSTLNDVEIAYEEEYLLAARKVAGREDRLPVLVTSSSSINIHERTRALLEGQVPIVRGVRNALVAVRAASRNTRTIAELERPGTVPSAAEAAELRARIATASGMPAPLATEILTAYGIDFVARSSVASIDEAVQAADRIGYPVVLKIDSPDIAHRSDVGGVAVGIADREELVVAAETMLRAVTTARPDAVLAGFEVQQQIVGAVEAFTGYVTDPVLGPTLAVGSGGVMVELLDDTVVSSCPADPAAVRRQVEKTKLGQVLAGYRNLVAPTDVDFLVELVCRLSWLAADLGDLLVEADLNPVLVNPGTGTVRIVDALLVRKERS